MKTLEDIQKQLQSGYFELTRHALKRQVERNISRNDIRETGGNAIIIEDYPDDKYSPSCLLLGFTKTEKALHIQVGRVESDITKIITLYEPNKNESHLEFVNEVFEISGKFYLVQNIPAQVCSRCGEEVFSGETSEAIRVMLHGKSEPIKSVVLDVFSYQQELQAS